ncbi:hypothetical protein GQ53DRAFT_738986 [Thozetella sp. PMI_491]|nr:hypothetical protein GQ53DRAFT_738986 [Thozetella sp. PMI_491]
MPEPSPAKPSAVDPQPDDDDEWEYEYSTTETETYYLTLDLSLPDFVERGLDEAPNNRRGGFNIWYNSAFNKSDPNPHSAEYIEEGQDSDDGAPAEREDQDEEDAGSQVPKNSVTKEPQGGAEELGNIQILELHSDHPIVSYRGKTLRGTWMRNMGTELILAAHDPDSPLPTLRSLAPDVDLLAASSTRIAFEEVDISERKEAGQEDLASRDAKSRAMEERLRRNKGVYVNVTSDKMGERVPQACFLEDLTALKRKRGEMDEVTVVALDPPPNNANPQDEMYMRRNMRNVKSKQRYRRKKAEIEAELQAAIERGEVEAPAKRRGRPKKTK